MQIRIYTIEQEQKQQLNILLSIKLNEVMQCSDAIVLSIASEFIWPAITMKKKEARKTIYIRMEDLCQSLHNIPYILGRKTKKTSWHK